MRAVLLLATVGVALSATNTITTAGNWFTSADNWSLTRFPRDDDHVVVNAAVTLNAAVSKPTGYEDTTEGTVIEVSGATLEISGVTLHAGPQVNAPENCVLGTFSAWNVNGVADACTATCDGGTQSRSRTNTQPRYGGDVCPDASTDSESQGCNEFACGCANGKAHGDVYTGFGKNYCNQCKCHNGNDVCDNRECDVQTAATVCDSTTCEYGVMFADNDEFLSFADATSARGVDWQTTEDFELSTLVKHDRTDANGATFHCAHVRDTTDTCRCYCATSGDHHIWHHAQRHADTINLGKTSAGCECAAGWTAIDGRGPFTGCQNPDVAGAPASYGPERHSSWCKVVQSSCPSNTRAVTAGADWDTCEEHAMYKVTVSH